MADGTMEDDARAAKMDEWVIWETEERDPQGAKLGFFLVVSLILLLRGPHPPSVAHSAPLGSTDIFCSLL